MKNIYYLLLIFALASCKKGESLEDVILPISDTVSTTIDVSSSSIIEGDSVSFILKGELPVSAKYSWTFNGATPNTSTLANPKVQYMKEGTYEAKLIVKYNNRVDTIVKSNIVKVEKPISLISKTLELSASTIVEGDSVSFFLKGDLPASTEYYWIFNGAQPNISTLASPKVKYMSEGTYDVKLVVKYKNRTDTLVKTDIVKVEKPGFPISTSMEVSSSSLIVGDQVNFFLKGDLPNSTEYSWIFTGAIPSTSNLASPRVKYVKEGTHEVKLIIKYSHRSDTIIKSNVVKVESTITDGLIAFYPFNGNANDMTGKGHDGTPSNAVLTTDRFGKENSAYLFNGTSSSIIVKDKADLRLNNTNFTINGWVKLDQYDPSHGCSFLIKRFTGSANGWGTSITGYASQYTDVKKVGSAFFNVSGGGDPFAVGNKLIELNKWCMLTVVYDLSKQSVSLYINGVLDNVTLNIPSPNGNVSADMFIGSDNVLATNSYHVKGKIDDIGFYNRKLSVEEINRIYFNSNAVSNPPVFDL